MPVNSSKSRLPPLAFTPLFVFRVNRTSAYEHPSRLASVNAMSERPLNFESRTRPCGVCAIRSPIRSLAATAAPDIAIVFTKSLRFMVIPVRLPPSLKLRRAAVAFATAAGSARLPAKSTS
jgi:hypothetical protein